MAPHIDRNTLSDIKVRAGNVFEFDVKVSGEPPPTMEWSLRGDVLLKTESVYITNRDHSTKLKVIDAKRSDDGIYYLVAKNVHGVDKAAVKVTVIGKFNRSSSSSISISEKRLQFCVKLTCFSLEIPSFRDNMCDLSYECSSSISFYKTHRDDETFRFYYALVRFRSCRRGRKIVKCTYIFCPSRQTKRPR